MKILFTTSDGWFSKTIRHLTEENVSHCAIELPVGIVLHSNLKGLHLQSSRSFRRQNNIVYSVSIFTDLKVQKEKVNQLLDRYEFSFYDFGALFFLGLSLGLRKYLKLPLPKSNLWKSTGMFLCTEWVTKYVFGQEDGMITPKKLYLKLKDLDDKEFLETTAVK